MSFRFALSSANVFLNIVAAIKEIVDEAAFKISPEGVSLRAIDETKMAMVDLMLQNHFFDEFECTEESLIGLNMSEFHKVLKNSIKRGRQLTVNLPSSEAGMLTIHITNGARITHNVPLIGIEYSELPTLKLETTARLVVETDSMKEAVEAVSRYHDNIIFTATPDEFTVEARSERGSAKYTLTQMELINLEVDEDLVRSAYSAEYLKKIFKHKKLSPTIFLEFSSDGPLRVKYPLEEGVAELNYYLAPRLYE